MKKKILVIISILAFILALSISGIYGHIVSSENIDTYISITLGP